MANLKATFLTKAEEDYIHDKSIECLKEVGIGVDSKSVLEMLEKKGASVDYEINNAKITEKMVNEALEAAPNEVTLCGWDPTNDLPLPASSYPYSAMNGCAVFIRDKDTNEYRDTTAEDAADVAKLCDSLDGINILWPAVTVKDRPAMAQTLYELWITLTNCSKHFMGDAIHGAHNAQAQVELASLLVGGKEELKKRPIISMIVCPLAPLFFEKGAIESQVAFAKAGVPVVALSMASGGLSAPVTVAGMMLTSNAENLASLVITQAAAEGAPHVFGAESAPMNMADGSFNYDAPEFGLIHTGMAQMARRYNLPSFNGDFGGFSVGSDQRETLFDSFITFCSCSGHTDIVGGLGSIDNAKGICFKQLLIDTYTWECCREYLKPIDITDEKLGLDVLRELGPRGSFLTHPHTLKYLRNELIQRDKQKYELLIMEKEEQMTKAGELANKILTEHQVAHVDEAIIQKGYDIIKAYEKKYAQ